MSRMRPPIGVPPTLTPKFSESKRKKLSRIEETTSLVNMLYDLIESMHYVQSGVSIFISESDNQATKNMIANTYHFATMKFGNDYSRLIHIIEKRFPHMWKNVKDNVSELGSEIEKLEACFAANNKETRTIKVTMSRIRGQVKDLWNIVTVSIVSGVEHSR